jgi:ATP-binding protein involved in chromosome partitioning
VLGVVENMSGFPCPHCGEPLDPFGVGGGDLVAERLTRALGTEVPVLARIPFDPRLREGGDTGHPLVVDHPDAPAAASLVGLAEALAARPRGLSGMNLTITPA